MINSILLGPITLYKDESEKNLQVKELLDEGWIAIYCRTKGELMDSIRAQTPEPAKSILKGIIICISYKPLPKE